MTESLLSIAQNCASELSIAQPLVVVGNVTTDVRLLLRCLNAEGRMQAMGEYRWKTLTKEATFTSLSTSFQGELSTLAPGFRHFVNDTMRNRDGIWRYRGNLSPQEWQDREALNYAGTDYGFRDIDGSLFFQPSPGAGQTIAFEYATKNWVESADGLNSYDAFQADTDVPLLDSELLILAGIYRFRQNRSLDFRIYYERYEHVLNLLKTNDTPAGILNMTGARHSSEYNTNIIPTLPFQIPNP